MKKIGIIGAGVVASGIARNLLAGIDGLKKNLERKAISFGYIFSLKLNLLLL
jgi:3-hydroxyisobutyrate dehydrogenase-like beta-hydroxyacid dehydrogenase